jgi:hypothetical protein
MTNDTTAFVSATLRIASLSTVIAIAGFAQGCSRSDEAQAAVKESKRSFSEVAAGDSTASDTFSLATYRETESLVAGFASDENGYGEAAAISLSLSKLGQASLASKQASATETESLQKTRVIRGMLNEWLTMTAIAEAAGQFDASVEIAEIERTITLREDDILQYTRERESIDSRIAELDAQITDLMERSGVERNKSGALELQMPRVSATEAATIVERVREHTLRADNLELEASRISGVVGQLRPGAKEISLNVDKAASQIELLQKAANEMRDRETASRNDAQEAQQAATESSQRITAAAEEYASFRDSEVSSANEKAITLVRGSINALRDAKNVTKQAASLTKASAQQTLAECYWRQANGHLEAATLYQALNEAGVAGDWESKYAQAMLLHQESTTESNDAYISAASSLRGARIRGIEGEKVEAAAIRLEQLGGVEPEPEFEETLDEDFDDDFTEEMSDEDENEDFSEEDDG